MTDDYDADSTDECLPEVHDSFLGTILELLDDEFWGEEEKRAVCDVPELLGLAICTFVPEIGNNSWTSTEKLVKLANESEMFRDLSKKRDERESRKDDLEKRNVVVDDNDDLEGLTDEDPDMEQQGSCEVHEFKRGSSDVPDASSKKEDNSAKEASKGEDEPRR